MKNLYFLYALLFVIVANSQSNKQIQNLVQAEMKSASKLKNFATNPNTQNYNVTYHKLEFTIDPTVYFVSGKITTTYTALSTMNSITFDMANELVVSSVRKNNVDLVFTESGNNELVINLPVSQATGTSGTVEITYSGAPPINGFQAFSQNNHNGAPIVYTLSEPYGARDWWPCKQDLNDKVDSIDVFITAPSQYVAVSNGVEPSPPVVSGANKTTHFHHGYPIPAYLICMSVTNYQVFNQVSGTGANQFPVINYLYPETYTAVVPQLALTPLILDLYKTLYEIYPFHNEKYGHAQFGWGGGMEHTTVSFMVGFDRGLIAHEMAHQWFGDKITCGTWQDIWLNESFATYVAAQVIENFDGANAFVLEKENMINYATSDPSGSIYIPTSQISDVYRIFDYRLTYIKGAMVIEMLRYKMGNVMFYQAIKNYLADTNLAYKYAVTTNLQSHLEAVYGSSLQEFFNDWIYNQGYPSYEVIAQNISATQVQFTVNQSQSDSSVSFFEMPIPLRVFGFNGQIANLKLQNTTNGQTFIENIPFEVAAVEIDPDKHLLSANNTTEILPTLTKTNFDLNKNSSVSPNPVNDVLKITVPNFVTIEKVFVYNAISQKVLETKSSEIISVNDLSNGVYQLEVSTSEGTIHKKFIKK
jgi:aminopeptidase N